METIIEAAIEYWYLTWFFVALIVAIVRLAAERLIRAVRSDNVRQGAVTDGKPTSAAEALRQRAEREVE